MRNLLQRAMHHRHASAAESAFLDAHPEFASTRGIDALRESEYSRFDEQGHTYLDYTGGGVYAQSQLQSHHNLLARSIAGNPHSGNLASAAMTGMVDQAREVVRDYFRASPDEYEVIFTPNATGALKLVAESYPFAPGGHCLLTVDNHNSVNGIREFARRRGASVTYAGIEGRSLRLDAPALTDLLEQSVYGPKLFAYPAQSNFSGVQHPLSWIDFAQQRGWDVLLDAAAFVPTNRLDLSQAHPEFVSMSFYKMFGYPTGLGALIARREALARLQRPWFSGGTITLSSVSAADDDGGGFYFTPTYARFEDGTVNYLSIPAVEIGMHWMESVGIDKIHLRTKLLTGWLLEQLQLLQHSNGEPVVRLYGPCETHERGGTIAMNFLDPSGALWSCWRIERLANERKVSIRAGCHCNPGAREIALGYTRPQLAACFKDKDQLSYAEFMERMHESSDGVVRASLGLASTFGDVEKFVSFAREFRNRVAAPEDLAAYVGPQHSACGETPSIAVHA